jgi:hypothetical protein
LVGDVAAAQAAGRRPTQDDRNGDDRKPGIGRRGYEFVDQVSARVAKVVIEV